MHQTYGDVLHGRRVITHHTILDGDPGGEPMYLNPPRTVETFNNHVYFYSDVEPDRCLALMQELRELDDQLRNEALTRESTSFTPIWLHVHSLGGNLFSALAVADQIMRLRTPIYSVVEGIAASAATFLSLACSKRYITPNSYMLIHQFSTWFVGTHESFKDEMALQTMLIDTMRNFYKDRTQMGVDQIRAALEHDSWYNADQALRLGLVDEIRGVNHASQSSGEKT